MSTCYTQVYASFPLVDPSLRVDTILLHLQQLIQQEIRNDEYDAVAAYSFLDKVFDCECFLSTKLEDNFQLDDYCALKFESDLLIVEGQYVINSEDHLTRWISWVLFRDFGAGDSFSLSTDLEWDDGSGTRRFFEIHRDGTVNIEAVYSEAVEDF